MALQDVCGFRKTPLCSRWNSPALLSMPARDPTLPQFEELEGDQLLREDVGSMRDNSPLHLYVPSPEFLTQKPLQFSFTGKDFPTARRPFSLSHGTTTVAFVFQGGVIAAADTRASCSGLVACPAAQKVLPVHSHLVVTTSGSGADCMFWQRILARECRLYHLRNHRRLSAGGAAKLLAYMLHPFKGTDVCVALILCGWDTGDTGDEDTTSPLKDWPAMQEEEEGWPLKDGSGSQRSRETKECVTQACDREGEGNRVMDSHRELMAWREEGCEAEEELGGVENKEETELTDLRKVEVACAGRPSAPKISRIKQSGKCGVTEREMERVQTSAGKSQTGGPRLYYVCSDGTILQGELFSVGSGSPYAYSVLDCGVQWRLSLSEAVSLAREAVYRASHRDAYSGNCVDLFYISSEGWRRREREDLKEEFHRERQGKNRKRVE